MGSDVSTTIDQTIHAGPLPRPAAAGRSRGMFHTFSMWALCWHAGFALALATAPAVAHGWLLPGSHLLAWAVFVGSHVLVGLYPETMHRPRIAGHDKFHGKSLHILIGHELLHVSPLVALYMVPGVWPAAGALGPADWALATLPALALGGAYFAWQHRDDNAYGARKADMRLMFTAALAAGLAANALAAWRLM